MTRLAVALAALLFTPVSAAVAQQPAADPKDDGWVPLFNGKDLDGWTPKIKGFALGDNHNDTFRVENGVLKASYDKYTEFDAKFGHLFYKEKFSHYRLRVEYRFVGEQVNGGPGWATRNNGLMLHCQDPQTMRKDQEFPVSIEAQLLGGLGKYSGGSYSYGAWRGARSTGNLCTPGTNVVFQGKLYTTHCLNSRSRTYNGDGWVTAEFEVHGSGTIRHYVEGELVLEYEKPQYDERDADAKKLVKGGKLLIEEGYIAIQAESHPTEFRKIEIKVLKK